MDEAQLKYKDAEPKSQKEEDKDLPKEEGIIDKRAEIDHDELIKLTKEAIHNIIESDPLLCGLPADVTIEELKAQIAVAQGQAITLYLNRGELPKLGIVVIYFCKHSFLFSLSVKIFIIVAKKAKFIDHLN